MTRPARLILLAAAVATLAACNRPREEEQAPAAAAPPAAAETQAEAAAPMAWDSKTPWAEVKLTLPVALRDQPDLHARLYADEVRKLRQFAEGSQAARTEAGSDNSLPTFEKTIDLTLAGETGKLFSLKRTDFEYAGGAHPNTVTSGVLWDKAMKRTISAGDLFRKGANLSVLDQALCSAVNTAKRARVPDSAVLTLDGKDWSCPRAMDTAFVLTPGTTPGKAGGLTFLIGPYQVGPYVEGGYEIAIPVAAFRSLLAVAYADEFAGAPVKAGDVTPAPKAAA